MIEWIWSRTFISLYFCNSEKGLKNSGLNADSDSDLCDAGAVLNLMSYQATWEPLLIDYKPVDVENSTSTDLITLSRVNSIA